MLTLMLLLQILTTYYLALLLPHAGRARRGLGLKKALLRAVRGVLTGVECDAARKPSQPHFKQLKPNFSHVLTGGRKRCGIHACG